MSYQLLRFLKGELLAKIWNEALSGRIWDMVNQEPNPQKAAEDACRDLDCPNCDEPNPLGQFIVEHNLNLHTWINCSIIVEVVPFSTYVTEDDTKAFKAFQSTKLKKWVNQAKKLMTGEALESHMKSHFSG